MKRLIVVVEGSTEEGFVKRVLGPHLQARSIFTYTLIVTTLRDELTGAKLNKGGGAWRNWFKDLRRVMGENPGPDVAFTTLIDLYGLPNDFPQLEALSKIVDTHQRASELEAVMSKQFGDYRFIPYVQRHEFEALVLAGLGALAGLLDAEEDLQGLEQLRSDIAGHPPEDVNDGPDTAPSKRLLTRIPSYRKTLHGPLVVESTGLASLRAACPRFDAWVAKLEGL
ncbi:DUF4276 family protein [Archangium violaceum]|uniref:DUF4276 family protein n=1 Tax=Archangium violaceum Cb vi76 TaxID=1406225 RepID=A0A084STC1_9BACT|nr:DUF4276 family protein [Archangium violaceum]KFA91706.1 hypothetical protein Q664_20430 [Archangium violaceum Cb vi76]